MRIVARVVALGGVLVAVAPPAEAQYPQRREGFWIGFGLGYGSANITCDSCDSGPPTGGVTASLKLRGTPRHRQHGVPLDCREVYDPDPQSGGSARAPHGHA